MALQAIAKYSGDVFIPRGVDVPALDRSISYEFAPQKVKVRILPARSGAQRPLRYVKEHT